METEKWYKESDTMVSPLDIIKVVLMACAMVIIFPVILIHNLWNTFKKK